MVWLLGFSPLHLHQWFVWRALPQSVFDSSPVMSSSLKTAECLVRRYRATSSSTFPNLSQQSHNRVVTKVSYMLIHSFIHAYIAHIPFIHVFIFTLCLISFVPHERVIPNMSDQKGLTNQVVFKWQVPPSIHFTKYLPNLPNVFSNHTLNALC